MDEIMELELGTLKEGEYHPSADSAMRWLNDYRIDHIQEWIALQESIASTALSGNRLAEILHSTIERLDNHQPVSDRYLLGLCWFMRDNQSKL